MTATLIQPQFFDVFAEFGDWPADDPSGDAALRVSSYQSALQEPTASLVGHTHDRPDVASVAILGYN